ncbi:MAG TPA: thioredoxin-like domain-containing protein [Candidatus Methylacidiphilales bacterium]|jgi:nucleoredoxin|nr:thioredoxin-like domain-containing protein [Candidatus Methylacidiphilales bacterium]
MIKTTLLVPVCLAFGFMNLPAQSPAPANTNPLAGLNLNDPNAWGGTHAASVSTTPSPFVAQFKGHLLVMDHGTPKPFDVSTLKDVKYWAFYYSASWCVPCRAFTPQLVDFYKHFKSSHPNFELIFVGNDSTQDAMLAYMKEDKMPWPSMQYPDLNQPGVSVKKYCGPGIPDLVLTDENGKVLSDSFDGKDYVGPEKVMADIRKMVPMPDGV